MFNGERRPSTAALHLVFSPPSLIFQSTISLAACQTSLPAPACVHSDQMARLPFITSSKKRADSLMCEQGAVAALRGTIAAFLCWHERQPQRERRETDTSTALCVSCHSLVHLKTATLRTRRVGHKRSLWGLYSTLVLVRKRRRNVHLRFISCVPTSASPLRDGALAQASCLKLVECCSELSETAVWVSGTTSRTRFSEPSGNQCWCLHLKEV